MFRDQDLAIKVKVLTVKMAIKIELQIAKIAIKIEKSNDYKAGKCP